MSERKAPSYYLPQRILGVMGENEIKDLIASKKQTEWTSKKRIAGVLLILDYFARKGGAVSMSSELSRQYVSTFKRAKNPATIRQPLALLVHLGLIEITQKAIATPHRKASARYRLNPAYGKPRPIQTSITRQQVEKMATAAQRQETRLNRRHRTREGIAATLSTIGISSAGNELALMMLTGGEKAQGIGKFLKPLNEPSLRKIKIDPSGTIHHFVKNCPRELKPHLLLDGKPSVIVDMKAAHLVCLLCVARDRIKWMGDNGRNAADLEGELARYKATLESGDIYEELGGAADRKKFKKTLLSSLNMATSKAIHLPPYQRLKASFPRIVGIIQDIKQNDHRALSKQLQHFTAKIIEAATHEAQCMEIATLPDTDAMIVPKQFETLARTLLNNAIHEVTGLNLDNSKP